MSPANASPSARSVFLALCGAAAGVAVGIIALSFFSFTYTPYDGTIGPPSFYNFSPTRKIAFYLTLTPAALLGGAVYAWFDLQRSRRRLALGVIVSAVLSAAAVWRLPWTVRHDYAPYKFQPSFWIPVGLIALYALWALTRARRAPPPDAVDHAPVLRWLSGIVIVAVHSWLMFEAAGPDLSLATILTAVFGAGFAMAMRPAAGAPAPLPGVIPRSQIILERAAWALFALFPFTSLVIRVGLSLESAWARDFPYGWLAVLIAALALASATWRRLRGEPSPALAFALLPFAAAQLYAGCSLVVPEYDPYHQGEYIYPAWAMSQGLLPYRDIFFVHGFGFNFLPGWLLRDLIPRAPNLDVYFFVLVSALGSATMGWLYLKTLGRRWWPLAFVLAYATASAAATKSARYTPLYFVAAAITLRASTGRRAWSAVAGAAAFLALAFALDVGAVATVAGALALVALNLFVSRGLSAPSSSRVKSALIDIALYIAGFAPGALAAILWLHSKDLLDDFINVHIDYAAMKRHYDNLPFAQPGLMYFFSPAMTVIGAAALWRLQRAPILSQPGADQRSAPQGEPLFIFLAFFTLANAAMFLRGLDRSDAGHLVYASNLAWPVLAAVAALWTRDAGWPRAFTAAASLAALVLLQPFASVAFKGAELTSIHPIKMFSWYRQASHEPAALAHQALAKLDQFFGAAREIESRAKPGDRLLDLSNRPALFPWSKTFAPSRFYAVFYAPNLKWQREILDSLKKRPPEWVVWPAPASPGRVIDGVPLEVREWALTAWALEHATPIQTLPDGSTLMATGGGPTTGAESAVRSRANQDGAMRRAMTRDVDFGPAPAIWASADPGARRISWRASFSLKPESAHSERVPVEARGSGSLRITSDAPLLVPLSIRFRDPAGAPVFTARVAPGLTPATQFDLPLASLPGWTGAIRSLEFTFSENPYWLTPLTLDLEFSPDPIAPSGGV